MSSEPRQYEIECQHLGWVNDNLINELSTYLEKIVGPEGKVSHSGKKVTIEIARMDLNKRALKTYLKKFLHKFDLRDKLRVIKGPNADSYIIHKRKGLNVTDF
ncbi:MAG: 60S ribosomal protein L22 [Candidatus Helarchaeota archaeon]